jgi:hypothetical protein
VAIVAISSYRAMGKKVILIVATALALESGMTLRVEGDGISWSHARRKPCGANGGGVGLHYLEASPPAGPESVQDNPQEPVAAVEAARDAARSFVLLANRKLVTKREDLRM